MYPAPRPSLARVAAACALLPAALGSVAQTPGTYTGQTAQGQPIQVVVSTAPDGVSLEVTSIQASYVLRCELGGSPVGLSSVVWGYFPVNPSGSFLASYLWDRDFFTTGGSFATDGSVAGETAWAIAAVTRKAPHLPEVCASPTLAWSGNAASVLSLPGGARALRPDYVIEHRFDRSGRLVSQTVRTTRQP